MLEVGLTYESYRGNGKQLFCGPFLYNSAPTDRRGRRRRAVAAGTAAVAELTAVGGSWRGQSSSMTANPIEKVRSCARSPHLISRLHFKSHEDIMALNWASTMPEHS